VRAYEHLADFAGEAKFSTWLTKIAIHEAISRIRKRARVEELDSTSNADAHLRASTMPDEYNPERRAYDHELRSVLERAVDTLPEEYRSVVVLRLVEEMSVAETAECLDIGVETVKTRLHRARGLLRKQLQWRAGVTAPEIYAFHLSRCDRVVQAVFRRIHRDN
jgi:RNA polymerase sigma-70 factor (ECF subfamily)